MTNKRTAQMMGDPPYRTLVIEDVLSARRQQPADLPAAIEETQQHQARSMWDRGKSLGHIAFDLGVSLAQAYEWIKGEPATGPVSPRSKRRPVDSWK